MNLRGRAKRAFFCIFDLIKHISDASIRLHVGPYAAQASFFILLSLIPFTMFVLSLLHILLPYFLHISDADIIRALNDLLPYRLAAFFGDIVREIFVRSSGISIVTAALAVWFSSQGMMSVIEGINIVLSDGAKRNYLRTRIISVIYVFVFMILAALTIVVIIFGQSIMDTLLSRFPEQIKPFMGLFRSRVPIVFLVLWFFFTMFYKFMPKRHLKIRELIPGAALAALIWIIFTKFFSIYIGFAKSYDSIYGGFSYVIFGMLWLYSCLYILLLCADFNNWLRDWKKKKTNSQANPSQ